MEEPWWGALRVRACTWEPAGRSVASLPVLSGVDFCQLSGMHLLVGRYLEAGAAGLRWRAAQLIGTCSQNVAAIQEQVLGLGALRKLLRLLDRDSCDTVRVKALFAISCESVHGAGPGVCLGEKEGRGSL